MNKIEWTLNIGRISIKYLICTPRVLYSYNHYPSRSPSVKLIWNHLLFWDNVLQETNEYDWLSQFMHNAWETVCGDSINSFITINCWYILTKFSRVLFPQILPAAKTLYKKFMNIQNLENTTYEVSLYWNI